MAVDGESMRQLVADAQRGDRVAADRLVREHDAWVRSAIYAVTGRVDLVEDIAQQVWTRAWQRLDTLDNPRRLRPWLYAVARNTAIDASTAHRREQRRTASLDERFAGRDGRGRAPASPFGAAAGHEMQETLLRAVQALPALYREPFVLRHLENWTYAEIGAVLDLPVPSVETRLVRARRMLREMLDGKIER